MKIIILDFDGTIGDTRSLIVRTMQQTIAELNLPARSDDQCASMIGLPLKQTFTDLIPMTDEMGDLCAATYRRHFFENDKPGAVPIFPHVRETLAELHRRGHTLTIASSRSKETLVRYVDVMGIADEVSLIISADEVRHAKPHPEPVLLTLDAMGRRADEAIVVGDTTFDIAMGRAAGTQTVGVSYGNGTVDELRGAGADYVIDDFSELLNIVGD